jgi:hypothetical protein
MATRILPQVSTESPSTRRILPWQWGLIVGVVVLLLLGGGWWAA